MSTESKSEIGGFILMCMEVAKDLRRTDPSAMVTIECDVHWPTYGPSDPGIHYTSFIHSDKLPVDHNRCILARGQTPQEAVQKAVANYREYTAPKPVEPHSQAT